MFFHSVKLALKILLIVVSLYITISLGYTQLFRYNKISLSEQSLLEQVGMILTQLPIDVLGNGTLFREFTFVKIDPSTSEGKRTNLEFANTTPKSGISLYTSSTITAILKPSSGDIFWRVGYCTSKTDCFVSKVTTTGNQALSPKSEKLTEVFGIDKDNKAFVITVEQYLDSSKLGSIPLQ